MVTGATSAPLSTTLRGTFLSVMRDHLGVWQDTRVSEINWAAVRSPAKSHKMSAVCRKPLPERVTRVPPEADPSDGLTLETRDSEVSTKTEPEKLQSAPLFNDTSNDKGRCPELCSAASSEELSEKNGLVHVTALSDMISPGTIE